MIFFKIRYKRSNKWSNKEFDMKFLLPSQHSIQYSFRGVFFFFSQLIHFYLLLVIIIEKLDFMM